MQMGPLRFRSSPLGKSCLSQTIRMGLIGISRKTYTALLINI